MTARPTAPLLPSTPATFYTMTTELLKCLEDWGKHFLETRNPAGLDVLRAKTTIKNQSDRIGELLEAVERGNECREMLKRCERSRDDAMKNVEVIAESHKWCSIQLEKLESAVKPLAAACYRLTDTDDWRGVAKIMVACHTLMDTHPELFPANTTAQPPR